MMKRLISSAVGVIMFATMAPSYAGLEQDIESCTGEYTRVAWARGGNIWGIDTRDGKGARKIMADSKSIERLDIATDGQRVVYTHQRSSSQIWSVKWDGTDNRKLLDGALTSVWYDQSNRKHYVLYLSSFGDGSRPVKKFALYDPSSTATLVDASVGWCFFNLSADGKLGGIEYKTWGDIGVIQVPGGSYTSYHKGSFGCQCQIAPDNSNFFMGITEYSGGVHPDYTVWNKGGARAGTFKPPASSVGNPRWAYNASKTRCIVLKSPDGSSGNVYMVAFSDDMKSVRKTVKITTEGGCGWPAAWFGSLGTSSAVGSEGAAISGRVLHSSRANSAEAAFSIQGRTLDSGSRRARAFPKTREIQ